MKRIYYVLIILFIAFLGSYYFLISHSESLNAATEFVKTVNTLEPDDNGNVNSTDDSLANRKSLVHSRSNRDFNTSFNAVNTTLNQKADKSELGKHIGNKKVNIKNAEDGQVLGFKGEDIVPVDMTGGGLQSINLDKTPNQLLEISKDNAVFKPEIKDYNDGRHGIQIPAVDEFGTSEFGGVTGDGWRGVKKDISDNKTVLGQHTKGIEDNKEELIINRNSIIKNSEAIIKDIRGINKLNSGEDDNELDLDKIKKKQDFIKTDEKTKQLALFGPDGFIGFIDMGTGSDTELREQVGELKTGNKEDWKTKVASVKSIVEFMHKRLPPCTVDNAYLGADKDDKNHGWREFPHFIKSLNSCEKEEQHFVLLTDSGTFHPKEPTIRTDVETGYTYIYIPQLQFDHVNYGVVGKDTILHITGENTVNIYPELTLKDANTKLKTIDTSIKEINSTLKNKADTNILHKNIEDSESVTVEKLADNKIKLHATIKGGRGLEKVYEKDLANVKKGTKFSINLGKDTKHLKFGNAIALSEIKKEIKTVEKFLNPKDFYDSNQLEINKSLHFKEAEVYPFMPTHGSSIVAETDKFKYTNYDKSIMYVMGQMIPFWFNQDEGNEIKGTLFSKYYKDMIKARPDDVVPALSCFSGETPGWNKRSYRNYLVEPALFTGDFEYMFYNITMTPTKDIPFTKRFDDKYSWYFECGICDLDNNGVLIYPGTMGEGNLRHNDQRIYMYARGDKTFINTGEHDDSRYPTGKGIKEKQWTLSIRVKRVGDNLTFTAIGTDGNYVSDTDTNVKFLYEMTPVQYADPLRLYISLMSSCSKKYGNFIYYTPKRAYIGTKPTGFVYNDTLYTFHNRIWDKVLDNWSIASIKTKEECLQKHCFFSPYNLTDAQTDFHNGTYSIVTEQVKEPRNAYVRCPYVGTGGIFSSKVYKLGDAIGIDGITIKGKLVNNATLKESKEIEKGQAAVVLSVDEGKTWLGYDMDSAEHKWVEIEFENIKKPTSRDIGRMMEFGLDSTEMNKVRWDKLPHEGLVYNTIMLGFYMYNPVDGQLYLTSIDFDVVDYRHWDMVNESKETYDFHIDFEKQRVDFEIFKDFPLFKAMLYVVNPEIIKDGQNDVKSTSIKPTSKVLSKANTNYIEYCIIIIIVFTCLYLVITLKFKKDKNDK